MTSPERIKKGLYWDRGWSLVEGCTAVSPGCDNCWSRAQTYIRSHQKNRHIGMRYQGLLDESRKWNGKVRMQWQDTEKPLFVKKPTVWSAWNDLFHPGVELIFQAEVLNTMSRCPQHVFLILTKRPGNMRRFFCDGYGNNYANFPNVWLGVTAENQKIADERIPILLSIPAAVRFVSYGPALGPVDFSPYLGNILTDQLETDQTDLAWPVTRGLDWIIAEGESGPGARPVHPDWIRSARDQCLRSRVAFFFKQRGEWTPSRSFPSYITWVNKARTWVNGGHCYDANMKACRIGKDFMEAQYPVTVYHRVGKKKAGRMLDGRTWDQLPG